MTEQQKTGPAQPDQVERPEDERSPARTKDRERQGQGGKDDMPGADGPSSAGANEDTYD
jgi:hypothetical protein